MLDGELSISFTWKLTTWNGDTHAPTIACTSLGLFFRFWLYFEWERETNKEEEEKHTQNNSQKKRRNKTLSRTPVSQLVTSSHSSTRGDKLWAHSDGNHVNFSMIGSIEMELGFISDDRIEFWMKEEKKKNRMTERSKAEKRVGKKFCLHTVTHTLHWNSVAQDKKRAQSNIHKIQKKVPMILVLEWEEWIRVRCGESHEGDKKHKEGRGKRKKNKIQTLTQIYTVNWIK